MALPDMHSLRERWCQDPLFMVAAVAWFLYPFMGGLYYPWQWGTALGINGCILALIVLRRREICLSAEWQTVLCFLIMGAGAFWNLAYGLDKDAAWMGVLRLAGWLLFALLIWQWPVGARRNLISLVPVSGALMVVVSLAAGQVPAWRPLFYETNRLSGPFQYANTFALFLLVGLVVKPPPGPRPVRWGLWGILLFGLVATGSRGGLLLFVLWFLFHRRPTRWALAGFLAMAAVVGIVAVLQNGWVFARFLQADSLSTVWGRLLYMKDGLKLLLQHPLGVGNLGWFYLQRMIQTGVYNVRYVHNDWLQVALDYGTPAALALLMLVVRRLRSGSLEPAAGCLIALHCLIDPDLEFQCMVLVWILCLNPCRDAEPIKLKTPVLAAIPLVIAAGMLPRTAADFSFRFGYGMETKLASLDTEYAIQQMLQTATLSGAAQQARNILEHNAFVPVAWEILAEDALSRGAYEDMADAQWQAVVLLKYDQTVYDEALVRLRTAQRQGWDSAAAAEQMNRLLEFSDATMAATDPIAWKLRDQPDIGFSAQTRLLIHMQQLSNTSSIAASESTDTEGNS